MINLLIHKNNVDGLNQTSFGGLPVKIKGEVFRWPICESCEGAMQFLGKVLTEIGLEQIFMCQNEPGCCEEWDPNDGGNAVVVTEPQNLEEVLAPEGFETSRDIYHGVLIETFDSESYSDAFEQWPELNRKNSRKIVGQFMGEPAWLQGEETPNCDSCKKPMRFVAQLEQGPEWETEMNFGGGGCAYLFDCQCKTAKFLFQC